MTPADFQLSLEALAKLIHQAGSPLIATDLRQIAAVLSKSKDKSAAAAIRKMSKMKLEGSVRDNSLAKLSSMVGAAVPFAEAANAKYASLLDAFLAIINLNESVSPAHFIARATMAFETAASKSRPQIREGLVREYVKQLEAALGDEAFEIVHKNLSEDSSVTPPEVVAIASGFTAKKATGRAKALQAIWGRHHSLMTFRAKAESRAGRSAA